MLYLCSEIGDKFAVYDEDDNTVEYVRLVDILNAYIHGVEIFGLNQEIYMVLGKGFKLVNEIAGVGMAIHYDSNSVLFSANGYFRKSMLIQNLEYDMIIHNMVGISFGVSKLMVYCNGWLYTIYAKPSLGKCLYIDKGVVFVNEYEIEYYGYSLYKSCPVIKIDSEYYFKDGYIFGDNFRQYNGVRCSRTEYLRKLAIGGI